MTTIKSPIDLGQHFRSEARSDQKVEPLPLVQSQEDISIRSTERTKVCSEPRPGGGRKTMTITEKEKKFEFGWRFWALLGVGASTLLVMHGERLLHLAKTAYEFLNRLQG